MNPRLLLFLTVTLGVVCCQNPRVEYLNEAGEDLLVRLIHEERDLLIPTGETYVYEVPPTVGNFSEEIWAVPAKCQNQTCDYIRSTIGVSMDPLTANVSETVSKYVIFPGPFNRGYNIESLDQPDCPVAWCNWSLENCPDFDQILDENGTVVACNINGAAVYSMICPLFAQTSIYPFLWDWYQCEASQALRVTIH